MAKNISFTLKYWKQNGPKDKGHFDTHEMKNIPDDTSFLEMLDILNEELIEAGEEPFVFDHDCREGICGMCSLYINGVPHGKTERGATTCQLYMRRFNDGEMVIGWDSHVPEFFWVTAQGGYGIQSAAGYSLLARNLLLAEPVDEQLLRQGVQTELLAPPEDILPWHDVTYGEELDGRSRTSKARGFLISGHVSRGDASCFVELVGLEDHSSVSGEIPLLENYRTVPICRSTGEQAMLYIFNIRGNEYSARVYLPEDASQDVTDYFDGLLQAACREIIDLYS